MRDRLDFSSISKIILDNRKTGAISQAEYYSYLFQYAFNQTDIKLAVPEDPEISKIISGQRNVSKDIIYLYQTLSGSIELKKALSSVLDEVSDVYYVKEQIYSILWNDISISQEKKQELSAQYADAIEFISNCLLFALSRSFIPKGKKAAGTQLILSDYLLDCRLPSVTRHFVGREKELKEIAEQLQREHCIFLEGIGGIGKSEIAKYYANHYKKQYSNILYLRYHENLRRTILEMDFIEDLKQLFFAYAPSTKQHPDIIVEIIEEVYRHTLTVELAAKTLTASGMEAKDFLHALRTEGLSLANPNKVVLTKDNVSHKQRLYQHIQTLFQIQKLSSDALDTLRNMVLMPKKGISKVLFHTWQGKSDWNITNDLVEYGWIQEDTVHNQILLHPYLHEVLLTETVPSITKCADLLKGIFENCIVYGMDVPYYNALLNTIESIYRNIKLDDAESATLFMDTTLAYLAKYGRMEAIKIVLNLMKNMPDYGENARHTAIYDCYAGYVEYVSGNYQKSKQYYLHGLELLEPFHPVNADLVSNLKNNLGQTYLALGDVHAALSVIEEAISVREKYGTISSHDTLVQELSHAQLLAANGHWQEARKRLFALVRFVKKYL